MTDPILRIEDLHKSFGETRVLAGVSLEVNQREVIVIIGPSGSGKSTLLRCINFLEQPTSGRIWFDGELIGQQQVAGRLVPRPERELNAQRKRIGMVFQRFNLFPHMTVLDNVIQAKVLLDRTPRGEAVAMGEDRLREVNLLEKRDQYPHRLSTGQQQRVAIARALMMKPELMLFDEPTSALDPELVVDVLEVIEKLAEDGMTMLVVTHEMQFAKNVANRIAFMDGGTIVEQGPPDALFNQPSHRRVEEFIRSLLHEKAS